MKQIGARLCTVTIILVFSLLVTAGVQAARLDLEIKSLQGLQGVYVVVESLAPDITKDGLSADGIKKTVEQHLTSAGIKLLTEDELSKPGGAIFYVALSSVRSDIGLYACNVRAEVIQVANLSRDTDMVVPATTWTSGTIGIVGANNVKQLGESAADIADEFAKDFQTANSKTIIKPKIT